MRRDVFTDEHEAFRDLVRTFVAKEILPSYARWEEEGGADREVWRRAGRCGLLGMDVGTEYGGGGDPDYRHHVILTEELARAGVYAPALSLHNEIAGMYLRTLATEEQRRRWLPGFCSGDLVTAIAITEPDAGSDVQRLRTRAVRDGDRYVLNGQKTFITNGSAADLFLVVARTGGGPAASGASVLVVEADRPGFTRGRKLDKIGMRAMDTVELFFDDVEVPAANLLGKEGRAFAYMMRTLRQERMMIAVAALAAAEKVMEDTLAYCREREVFGRPVGHHQYNRFVLAELATALAVARAFTDRCVAEHAAGRLAAEEAAMAKWWNTELCQKVVDRCLQLHGGYGVVRDFPVARAFVDTRVQTIYGGTTEVMKEMIGHSLI
ncbi:acyl-CoA dehydrogenase family protein [Streptosporangium pseudovulgare]|uniref:Acyl-[acyl-carrier-protein] dehydrogenase MbtN n=1 Tax=Streptosporangium pseudovulgare TaxID=35765 RepID=A0ABQ2R424_9ACTN|nr:acyl-CoA dehydrogenase family protein [Streptosporangium pseudovulgare]GGQ08885.1 acyl-CoA dehydrogenase [Streptosporangium pseudovulgare]